jgi:hypothetical protein
VVQQSFAIVIPVRQIFLGLMNTNNNSLKLRFKTTGDSTRKMPRLLLAGWAFYSTQCAVWALLFRATYF